MKKSIIMLTLLSALSVGLTLRTTGYFSNNESESFYVNPIALNGKPLDYSTFWKGSKGVLTLVKGNPGSADSPKVPFHIYLKREGQIINNGLSSNTNELYKVEVGNVLALARFGDELVIEPARKEDAAALRVIKLNRVDLLYMIFSPLFVKDGKDGC